MNARALARAILADGARLAVRGERDPEFYRPEAWYLGRRLLSALILPDSRAFESTLINTIRVLMWIERDVRNEGCLVEEPYNIENIVNVWAAWGVHL